MPKLVADGVAKELAKRIAAGEWADAVTLPPERVLAEEFGVARGTVRRAMTILESLGKIERHIGKGTFVTAGERDSFEGIFARMASVSPNDMMQVRKLLEPSAASFAAMNASAAEIEAIEEAHAAATTSPELAAFEHWDSQFHHRIFVGARYDFLREIHNITRVLRGRGPWIDIKARSFSEERRLLYCREHEAIVRAISQRDADTAAGAMQRHLLTVESGLFGR